MTALRAHRHLPAIGLMLAVITAALYWPITHHPFIIFDDADYITDNAFVNTGLSRANFVWAFHGAHAANWRRSASRSAVRGLGGGLLVAEGDSWFDYPFFDVLQE